MTEMNRIVAITGATGFVGRYVVERLLEEEGVTLRCLVRPNSDVDFLRAVSHRVELVYGDILEPDSLATLLDGSWGVINLAGYRDFWSPSRELYYDLNQRGAENVFCAAIDAGLQKAVQVSTPLAFGVPDQMPFDEATPPGEHPSDYARSKHFGDRAAWHLHEEENLPLTVVHLAAVIGAGDPRPTMEVRRAVEGWLPALVGADTTYTYVYVRDAAEAIVQALLREETIGRSYLVGGERATTREYFELIGELAGVPAPSWNIPENLLMPVANILEVVSSWTGIRPILPVDILKTTAAGSLLFDGGRAERELGLAYTPLRTALGDAVAEILA
jgi:dihydroflavonol-4-reductase